MPLSNEIKSKESKGYHRMLIIKPLIHSFVEIVSELDMPVSESITGQCRAPQKGYDMHLPSKESLTISHEHREYMVLDKRPRNQIREENQHSFKGIVQGLEYRLVLAERLSNRGVDYEDLPLCWRESIFINWANWPELGDKRGFYAEGSRGDVARLFWDTTGGQQLCVGPQYGSIFK